jgi:outer membrane lipoprotein-sorting protein
MKKILLLISITLFVVSCTTKTERKIAKDLSIEEKIDSTNIKIL